MAVKIGQSYVSEAAVNFAKNSSDNGENVLKSLQEKFPNLKISVGTAPFSGSGTNNLSISPKILREMQNNPDKKIEYEALIYDVANQNISQKNLKSHGFIITDDGGLRGWGISEKNSAATVKISEKSFFKNLQKKYSIVANGAANISKKFLRESLKDDSKRKKLYKNLDAAENIYKKSEKNENVRVKIDSEGEMTIESSKTTVTFNESKRARQLSAAKNLKDIQALMNLLQIDLEQCEEGLKNNYCDESEVDKVKKMIERATQRMNEIKKNPPKNNFSVDVLI